MSSFQQTSQGIQRKSTVYSKEKNKQKLYLKKDLMTDIPDKDFKTTVLKILKKIKDVEKVKKSLHEQNGNIRKEMKSNHEVKRKS